MDKLKDYYHKEVMVFIDEYDTPFVEAHTGVAKSRLERMMIRQGMMVKDLGTILVGKWWWKKELLMKLVVFLKRFSGCIRRLKEAGRKDRRKNDRKKMKKAF